MPALSVGVPNALGSTVAARSVAGIPAPTIKLITAQNVITVNNPGSGEVSFDPGIWVASLGAPLQLNVQRADYTKPVTVSEVLTGPGGASATRRLPSAILDGWTGLRDFALVMLRNAVGKVIAKSSYSFCPDQNSDLSRTSSGSALTSDFPQQCLPDDPFPLGEVWGIARGWAVDPATYTHDEYQLNAGTYTLTETISPVYVNLFHISAKNATARVTVKVVKGGKSSQAGRRAAPAPRGFTRVTSTLAGNLQPKRPQAPVMNHPPTDALPDLIPLPAWLIDTQYAQNQGDFLQFASTVLIGGHAQLDVEGFRTDGSQTMKAYQYFWLNGKIIGQAQVGTMGFSDYNSWHFQQFAQYKLLNAARKVVADSSKVGFCISPTDSVDLTLPHATWIPLYTGLTGTCGSPAALSVQEQLPLGWADTYFQTLPYQSFDISKIPDGTYYIEVIANPGHLLHETDTRNDVSLREVIIGGSGKDRTVVVPAWHGLDPE